MLGFNFSLKTKENQNKQKWGTLLEKPQIRPEFISNEVLDLDSETISKQGERKNRFLILPFGLFLMAVTFFSSF